MCMIQPRRYDISSFFFFNDTATTEIYTLSLHDALPILNDIRTVAMDQLDMNKNGRIDAEEWPGGFAQFERLDENRRSEEHTSELQSRQYLVCRLLLEKKKKKIRTLQVFKERYYHNTSTD